MQVKIISLMLFIFLPGLLPQSGNQNTFNLRAEKAGHNASLIVKTKRFQRSAHTITFADQEYLKKHEITMSSGSSFVVKIDGRKPLGIDGSIPHSEIDSFRLLFDGKYVAVPPRLYSDCYNPNFKKDYSVIKMTDDLSSVFIFMQGSDGAGAYDVIWVLRKDGNHTRLTNEGGDCSMLNFGCGLSKRP